MKLLIDMNLSPFLVNLLQNEGWETIHWSTIGDPRATDHNILAWARNNGYTVITNDLDFGHILAATHHKCPSVIQFRMQNLSPGNLITILPHILKRYSKYIEAGSLISVDESRSRVRILPI